VKTDEHYSTMNGLKWIYFLILLIMIPGCSKNSGNNKNIPVARVFDEYLYLEDLNDVIPSGLPAGDSIAVVRDFIDKWVRNQLILNKAELNLTDDEKDVVNQ